jgi:hypothetical protein
MPSVSMRLLTGQLNIDTWSEDVWPRILHGTRVVVSTFDILRDALDHAFVKIDMLSLIVFDEGETMLTLTILLLTYFQFTIASRIAVVERSWSISITDTRVLACPCLLFWV